MSVNYVEKSLERQLAAAKEKLLTAAEAGPNAARALAAGVSARLIEVNARTGEALSARLVLSEGGICVVYDTRDACLYGMAGSSFRKLYLGNARASRLISDSAWETDTQVDTSNVRMEIPAQFCASLAQNEITVAGNRPCHHRNKTE